MLWSRLESIESAHLSWNHWNHACLTQPRTLLADPSGSPLAWSLTHRSPRIQIRIANSWSGQRPEIPRHLTSWC